MSDIVTILVTFKVREGQKESFLAGLEKVVDTMSKEETFINSFVTEDTEDPNTLYNYETWAETRESFMETQFTKDYRQPYEAQIDTWLSDRTIDWLSAPLIRRETSDQSRWG